MSPLRTVEKEKTWRDPHADFAYRGDGPDARPSGGLIMTERTIFLAVLEIDNPSERSAYLDRACAGNSALRPCGSGI
jgi:hypothetical protein